MLTPQRNWLRSLIGLAFFALLMTATKQAAHGQIAVLHDFAVNGGGAPEGELTVVGSTLYGMAIDGGQDNRGFVYKLNTDGTGFQILHQFLGGAADGMNPGNNAALVFGGDRLYGTTRQGGASNGGTIFSIKTDGTDYRLLHTFTGGVSNGREAESTLTLAGSTLYGTTQLGGPNDYGTIFKLNTDGTGFRLLHGFAGGVNGARESLNPLTLDGSTLYGVSDHGGPNDVGTIFKINTDGTGFQLLHGFSYPSPMGYDPSSGLILSGSSLYGTTFTAVDNGQRAGNVYKVNTNGTGFQILHSFAGGAFDGANPTGELLLHDGALYGTTLSGGGGGLGTIFKVNTDGTGFQLVYEFYGTDDGNDPRAGVALAGSKLITTTRRGGAANSGLIVAVDVPLPTVEFAGTRFDDPPLGAGSYARRRPAASWDSSPCKFPPAASIRWRPSRNWNRSES